MSDDETNRVGPGGFKGRGYLGATRTLSIRLTSAERGALIGLADAAGVTVSDLIRSWLAAAVERTDAARAKGAR